MEALSTNKLMTMITSQVLLNKDDYLKIQNILDLELSKYDIVKKSYEIVITNNNEDLLKEYICSLQLAGKSAQTIQQYARALKHLLDFLGNKDVLEIRPRDLKAFYANYVSTHKISNTTLLNLQRYISPFFLFLEKEEYIERNPCVSIQPPKVQKPDISPLTGEEIEQLREDIYIKKQNQLRNRALLEFLIATGCRVSECAGVKISDVDFNTQSVKILGKGNKRRTVFFTGQCLKHIKDYLKSREDDFDILFYSPRTKAAMSKGSIERLFREVERDGKYHIHCNPHRFRHTFAQTCIDRGMPVEDTSFLMGHESVQTTISKYYKVNDNKLETAYKKYVN